MSFESPAYALAFHLPKSLLSLLSINPSFQIYSIIASSSKYYIAVPLFITKRIFVLLISFWPVSRTVRIFILFQKVSITLSSKEHAFDFAPQSRCCATCLTRYLCFGSFWKPSRSYVACLMRMYLYFKSPLESC